MKTLVDNFLLWLNEWSLAQCDRRGLIIWGSKLTQTTASEIADSLNETLRAFEPDSAATVNSAAYLKWMLSEIIKHPEWPEDKAHRWIGFVQGVMVVNKWSTVDAERDRVRRLLF